MAGRVERLTHAGDERLGDYVGMTDVQLRRRKEPAEGIFIAEGEKVIRRALTAGHRPRSMLLAERWLPVMSDAFDGTDAPIYVGSEELVQQVTGYRVHRGALAAMQRPPSARVQDLLDAGSRFVVLEDVNDHENVGAIFRSAAALDMGAVLLSPRCADPLYRRSIKVSMGAVFAVPWARFDTWPSGLDALSSRGIRVLALTPDPGATPLDRVDLAHGSPYAVLLGSEGDGLTRGALLAAGQRVRIPMAHGVDSLNVAAAAAVAFYALGASR
jgi:tRNA G18 (ribose-2'-O)-methylase SpoU